MPSYINTNIASLSAQRNLSKSQDSLNMALQRLSSGLRINSAKDDAAGLAITTRMTSQINGMNQAIRNANDGISLAQTADSSLDEVTNNLQRIRDLALQAANGTNSSDDRAALDVEVQQRLAEINRIASQTTFNGINLLDGSFQSQAFQIGASANQTVTIDSIGSAKAADLGLGSGTTSGTNLASSVATSGITAGSLSINGTTVTTDTTTNSSKALAAAINGNTTIAASGVTATAVNSFSSSFTAMSVTKAGQSGKSLSLEGAVGTALTANVRTNGIAAGSLTINGTTITTSSSTTSAKALAEAINAQTGTTGVSAQASTETEQLGAFTTTAGGTYTLSVTSSSGGTVTIANAVGAGLDATTLDGGTYLGNATVQANLAAAGISFSGTAAAGTLKFTTTDGATLTVSETSGAGLTTGGFLSTIGGGADQSSTASLVQSGKISLNSQDGSYITVGGTSPSSAGIASGTYLGTSSTTNLMPTADSIKFTQNMATSGITNNSLRINSVDITTGAGTTSARALAVAINATAGTGVTATANATETDELGSFTTTTAAGYGLTVGGVTVINSGASLTGVTADDIDTALATSTVSDALAALNISVSGSAANGNLKFTDIDGDNIAIVESYGATDVNSGFFKAGSADATSVTRTATSSVSLTSTSSITIANGSGGTAAAAGFTTGTYGGIASGSLTLNGTTITTSSSTSSAKALATAINDKTTTTGVTATALTTDSGTLGSFTTTTTAGYNLSVNGVSIISSGAIGTDAAAIDAALATTGTGTVGTNLANAGITFTGTAAAGDLRFLSASGDNLNIVETQGGTDKAGFFQQPRTIAHQYSSQVTLSSSNPVVVGGSAPGIAGFEKGTEGIVTSTGAKLSSTIASSGMSASDLSINGTTIVTSSSTKSAADLVAAINDVKDTTGVTAVADATQATDFGKFRTIDGYGTYSLKVGGVTVVDVSDTHAVNSGNGVTAAYVDTQLATANISNQLANAGITVSGSAAAGTLKFTDATGANISVTESGTAAGASQSLGTFVGINSMAGAGTYNFAVQTGTGSSVNIATVADTTATEVNAAYIDTQLADATVQTNLANAGISFTGSATAGTLKFTASTGDDVRITETTTGVGSSAATLGAFATVDSDTGGGAATRFDFQVTDAAGNTVSIIGAAGNISGAATITASDVDVALANATSALNTNGIYYTGSAVGNDLQFFTNDGSAVTVAAFTNGNVDTTDGFANLDNGTSATSNDVLMNGTSTGFTNLAKNQANAVNTKVGFANLDTDTASTYTSSVSLYSSSTITIGGNNPTTSTGFTAGTTGPDHTYTLTVGDGTTSKDLTFDMSSGSFGTSVKATDVVSAINNDLTLQGLGISASIDTDGKLKLESADGRNVTLKEATDDKVNFAVYGTSGFADADAGADNPNGTTGTAVTHLGHVDLASTGDLQIAGTSPTTAGLTAGSFGGANVKTVEAANATLAAIDEALKTISNTRAELGAYQNRFSSTVSNLTANAESLTASRSRIMDADFASETASLTRGQILQQAGTAMLAQANQLPNGVLSLLR